MFSYERMSFVPGCSADAPARQPIGSTRSGRERVMFVDENHQVDDLCERLRVLRDHLHAHVPTRRISGTTRNVVDVDTLTDSARRRRVSRASASSPVIEPWCGDEPIRGLRASLEPFGVWICFLISSVDEPDRLGPGLDPGLS